MTLPALYTLADEYLADLDALSDLDMPPEVLNDTLEGMRGDLETKATNVAMFVRNLESMAEQIKEAERTMALRRKAMEQRSEHIREYLLSNMERTGISKIESPWFAITIKRNPASVVIDAAGQVPERFYVYPPAPEPYPDKKALAAALKAGEEITGCHLEQKPRVDIR